VSIVTEELVKDQLMTSVADVMRYVPGVTTHQGENNRDQVIMRGNSSSADFFVDGVRDDVQYFRDLYNLDRVEVLKGPNALTFGRGASGASLTASSRTRASCRFARSSCRAVNTATTASRPTSISG
jgi:catecholate siderophore receptor